MYSRRKSCLYCTDVFAIRIKPVEVCQEQLREMIPEAVTWLLVPADLLTAYRFTICSYLPICSSLTVGYRWTGTVSHHHFQLLQRSPWHHCGVWCHWSGNATWSIFLIKWTRGSKMRNTCDAAGGWNGDLVKGGGPEQTCIMCYGFRAKPKLDPCTGVICIVL